MLRSSPITVFTSAAKLLSFSFNSSVVASLLYSNPLKNVRYPKQTNLGVWSQHDYCWINPKTDGFVVIGRSDNTLKQYGDRFLSEDIYFAIHSLKELQDYICVNQGRDNGDNRVILFVKMQEGRKLTPELKEAIAKKVIEEMWEEYVPQLIIEVPDIPYNMNNKRTENLVRKIIETNQIPENVNVKNPESLKHFLDIPEIVNYNLH